MKKKFLALLMSFCMIAALIPVNMTAFTALSGEDVNAQAAETYDIEVTVGKTDGTLPNYNTLTAAFNAVKSYSSARIEIWGDTTEPTTGNNLSVQDGLELTITNCSSERHAINFAGTNGARHIGVSNGLIRFGDSTSNAPLVIRAINKSAGGSAFNGSADARVLVKVNGENAKAEINDYTELCYGQSNVWVAGGAQVEMNGGVIHSAVQNQVEVQLGKFTQNGGYIMGHYVTGGNDILNYDGNTIMGTAENPVANVESALGSNILTVDAIDNYFNSIYGTNRNRSTGIYVGDNSEYIMNGGAICGIDGTEGFVKPIASSSGTSYGYGDDYRAAAIYCNSGTVTINDGYIYANQRATSGGAIQITNTRIDPTQIKSYDYSYFYMYDGRICYNCQYVKNGNYKTGGGAIRFEKGITARIYDGRIDHNSSVGGGGAIRLLACDFEMTNGDISYNAGYHECDEFGTAYSGGGVAVIWQEDNGNLDTKASFTGGKIHDNYTPSTGGGISLSDKANTGKKGIIAKISGVEIYNNRAMGGGGIYIAGRTDVTIDGGTKIYDNEATYNSGVKGRDDFNGCGGGVLIDRSINASSDISVSSGTAGKLTTKDCEVYDNTCDKAGGGISIQKGNYSSELAENGSYTNVYRNTSGTNGGGAYVKGLAKSTVNIAAGSFKNNSAIDGGGLYVDSLQTIVTLSGGDITENNASGNGGGINICGTKADVSLNGTKIDGNTSGNDGGGLYITGAANKCQVDGVGRIYQNTASNGGGVFATASSNLKVLGGLISENTASGNMTGTTARNTDSNIGVGGGIYVEKSATFEMVATGLTGVYANKADFAANDLYADITANSTIPNADLMDLEGYAGQAVGEATEWYKDYPNNDSDTSNSLLNAGQAGKRYDDCTELEKLSYVYEIAGDNSNLINTYVCLTLGYELQVSDLIITKEAADNIPADTEFSFKVTYKLGDDTATETFKLKKGESYRIKELRKDTEITIIEQESSEVYITDVDATLRNGEDPEITVDDKTTTFTIGDDQLNTTYDVVYTNSLFNVPTDLTIEKTGCSNCDPGQSFIFHVTSVELDNELIDPVDMYVTVQGNGTTTIKDLPAGNYNVEEVSSWSWRYTPDGIKDVTLNGDDEQVLITNDRTNPHWLNGNAYAINTASGRLGQ